MQTFLVRTGTPCILMHKRGNAVTMDSQCVYSDVVNEVASYCMNRSKMLFDLGLPKWSLIIDPGLGFAKNTKQNCRLIKEIPRFLSLTNGMPLLVGKFTTK